jgi:hypothetical protein
LVSIDVIEILLDRERVTTKATVEDLLESTRRKDGA